MAGSFTSPSFACAPASWCIAPGSPTEYYYLVDVSSAATFAVTTAAGVYSSTVNKYTGYGAGTTCPGCYVPGVDWYNHFVVYNGRPEVYNYDATHTRWFTIAAYW
jgi:hypothetical protein